ncbi:MAG TPA: ABC transporter permease subunit [Mycobacterium sp.]|nr:ABC transporter permease subunit [Mycobacterium sp.]
MTVGKGARAASVALVVVVLGAWEVVVRAGWISFETIPTPSATVRAWSHIAANGQLAGPVLHTLQFFMISFLLAAVAGIVLGMMIGLNKRCYSYLHASLEFLRFVPPPAIIPLVLLVSGFTDRSEILIAAFASLWPVLLNTAKGVSVIDPQLRDAGHALCLSRTQMLVKLVMPAALPLIVVGLRLALSLCLIIVITTEIVAIRQGIGFALVSASSALQPATVYAYLVTVGVLGTVVNVAFRLLERRVLLRGWSTS